MGSGTTALAAQNLARKFVGIDISPEYCQMAEKRLLDPTSATKNKVTTKDEIKQAGLFDCIAVQ